MKQGGAIAIGSDSQITISPAEDLRDAGIFATPAGPHAQCAGLRGRGFDGAQLA